ncbi:MAG: TIGR02597 family protein [Verrucomicrobia bacterium]|nr:TIGR02597 family protein [Verrucomicrobiota bacterium]
MRSFLRFLLAAVCAAAPAAAESVSSPAGGAVIVPIRGASDNFVSMPFTSEPIFSGGVTGIAANGLQLSGSNWTSGQFEYAPGTQPMRYYAKFTTGPLAGVFYRIVGNTPLTLILENEGDDLTNHPMGVIGFGDVVEISAYASIGQLFGYTDATLRIDPRPTETSSTDELRFFDNNLVGSNKPPTVYYFLQGAGWRRDGDPTQADAADTIIPPGYSFAVRRRNSISTSLVSYGYVPKTIFSVYIPGGNGTIGNDVYAAITYPEPVLLDNAGLLNVAQPALSVLKPSPSGLNIQDQLYIYSGATSGYNPVPGTYYYFLAGAGWRRYGSQASNIGQTVSIAPGLAILIRKKPDSPGIDWILPAQPMSP